jgi:C_GCAxxG_C_C family probable redox protein
MEKHEQAKTLFLQGFRCSQAVIEAFKDETGIDPDILRKVSIGLAAGSGAGGECGAVAAAYLVNGLIHGSSNPGDPEKFNKVMAKNIQFIERFKALYGNINCRDLINVDLFTDEGKKFFSANNIRTTCCIKYVEDAVKILHEIR